MNESLEFKDFLLSENFLSDLKTTCLKIPKSHKNLLRGYKFIPQHGNTLTGDSKSVGEIDEKKKTIKVAAPWHYSREMTILHEIAHAVWKYRMTDKLRKQWSDLVKSTRKEQIKKLPKENSSALKQNAEELFAMSYAVFYAKHKNLTYYHPTWMNFIEKIN